MPAWSNFNSPGEPAVTPDDLPPAGPLLVARSHCPRLKRFPACRQSLREPRNQIGHRFAQA